MNWIKTNQELPPFGTEVLAWHKSWIDEDFNPEGIRIAYLHEGPDDISSGWVIAVWNPTQDVWETCDAGSKMWNETIYAPSHWMQKPATPTH